MVELEVVPSWRSCRFLFFFFFFCSFRPLRGEKHSVGVVSLGGWMNKA